MNLAMLRAYALQLEEVAKLELADLLHALQRSTERMAMLESRARTDADLYLSQVREGTAITQVYAQFDAMDQAIAARNKTEAAHVAQQEQVAAKRNESPMPNVQTPVSRRMENSLPAALVRMAKQN